MDLLALAGFRAVRITQVWAPRRDDALRRRTRRCSTNVAAAAKLDERHRPHERAEHGQQDDAAHRRRPGRLRRLRGDRRARRCPRSASLIVGNEPNLNRYWLPQFNADGTDAAAPAYEALLAKTYDAVKARRPAVTVLGGAVSPRGGDVAGGIRPTHSPTVFIHDMGQAYRGERPDDADHGRLRVPSVRGQLERRAGDRHAPEHDDDRARRLRQARRAARRGVRRLRRCRSGTTSSASSRRSRRRSRASTRTRSRRRRSR